MLSARPASGSNEHERFALAGDRVWPLRLMRSVAEVRLATWRGALTRLGRRTHLALLCWLAHLHPLCRLGSATSFRLLLVVGHEEKQDIEERARFARRAYAGTFLAQHNFGTGAARQKRDQMSGNLP